VPHEILDLSLQVTPTHEIPPVSSPNRAIGITQQLRPCAVCVSAAPTLRFRIKVRQVLPQNALAYTLGCGHTKYYFTQASNDCDRSYEARYIPIPTGQKRFMLDGWLGAYCRKWPIRTRVHTPVPRPTTCLSQNVFGMGPDTGSTPKC
jgi:hypothetical protein